MAENLDLNPEVNMIWHMMLDNNLATEDQLDDVFEEHTRSGTNFQEVLVNFDIVGEDQLLELIADALGTRVVDVKEAAPDPDLIRDTPSETVRMYNILPVEEEDGILYVAPVDPLDMRMMDELSYVLGKEVVIVVGKPEDVANAIDHFYPENEGNSMSDVLSEMDALADDEFLDEEEDLMDNQELEKQANSTPIVRFVNVILYQAVKDEASDIHFEPFAEEFKIRYRIDGTLYEMMPPPKHLAVPVISRVKVISGLNIAERRLPQDGRMEIRVAGRKVDLRVSTLPTMYGESVVLRILDRSVVNLSLDSLGLPDDLKIQLRELIKKPNGIILVTGPTGSGKTTTLYSCLRELNTIEDKMLSSEDPVEYDLEGILQTNVNDNIGLTFAKCLKAYLRQDPDRIMVGEIRDLETASISVQAALTGHLVLSTLHTNDAPSAVTRLVDMGLEPFLITSTIEAVIGQRLVRRICNKCKEEYKPTDEEMGLLEITAEDVGDNKFHFGKGCIDCNDTGYKGRVGLFEIFTLSKKVRILINNKEPSSVLLAQARKDGMRTMREAGMLSALNGDTSIEEILKYT